jgi:hypothetical protein
MSEQRPDGQNTQNDQGQTGGSWRHNNERRDCGREWRSDWKRRDPFRGLFPGLILILLGILLFLVTRDILTWDNWWQYFLIGIGAIFLLDGCVHYLHPDFRHQGPGRFVPGIILVLVGIAFIIGFSDWWPLILVGVGAAILLGMLFRRT